VHESRQDAWRDNKVKIKKVRTAIEGVLYDTQRTEQILELVKKQNEF
jgi:hypothetical protein